MATNRYLKNDLLTNIPKTVKMVKRAGTYPETDFNTKQPTGRMQTLYVFLDEKGEAKHYAKEREETYLSTVNPGEEVVVTRQEIEKDGKRIAFLNWTAPGDVSLNNPQQIRSNVAENTQKKHFDNYQEQQDKKGIEISLQGLVQAYIIAGVDDPLSMAKKMRLLIKSAAEEIISPPSHDNF